MSAITDRDLLLASGYFFDPDEDFEDLPEMKGKIVMSLNDTFFWACADCEIVPDEEVEAVARLFRRYGGCGLYFWAAKKQGHEKVEFKDVQRMIDFVRAEEAQIAREPSSSKRAYMDLEKQP